MANLTDKQAAELGINLGKTLTSGILGIFAGPVIGKQVGDTLGQVATLSVNAAGIPAGQPDIVPTVTSTGNTVLMSKTTKEGVPTVTPSGDIVHQAPTVELKKTAAIPAGHLMTVEHDGTIVAKAPTKNIKPATVPITATILPGDSIPAITPPDTDMASIEYHEEPEPLANTELFASTYEDDSFDIDFPDDSETTIA
jgi:hypothetical protein